VFIVLEAMIRWATDAGKIPLQRSAHGEILRKNHQLLLHDESNLDAKHRVSLEMRQKMSTFDRNIGCHAHGKEDCRRLQSRFVSMTFRSEGRPHNVSFSHQTRVYLVLGSMIVWVSRCEVRGLAHGRSLR
jgi:hypothetical protein